MENSVLVPWLKCVFARWPKMLIGKKFPINVRALRFAMLDLIRGFADDVTSFDVLQEKLDGISQMNILTEHWVKNLSRPVFLLFIRAEQGVSLASVYMHAYICMFNGDVKIDS